jgi:hypothetical protein
MIRHIVLWKLDDSYPADEKLKIKKQLKKMLLHLLDNIDELRHLEVNFNLEAAAPSNFDVLLDTEFESISDLKAYQVHPQHLKVVEYIKTLKLQRTAIDYEF